MNADGTDFEAFWSLYPRHDAKAVAKQKWAKAVKRVPPAKIMAALRAQIDAGRFACEREFVPMAKTWLHQERWDDELAMARAAGAADGLAERWRDACRRADDRAKAVLKAEAASRNIPWDQVRAALDRLNGAQR